MIIKGAEASPEIISLLNFILENPKEAATRLKLEKKNENWFAGWLDGKWVECWGRPLSLRVADTNKLTRNFYVIRYDKRISKFRRAVLRSCLIR